MTKVCNLSAQASCELSSEVREKLIASRIHCKFVIFLKSWFFKASVNGTMEFVIVGLCHYNVDIILARIKCAIIKGESLQ